MKKKLLAIVLAVAMVICMIPMAALADSAQDNVFYLEIKDAGSITSDTTYTGGRVNGALYSIISSAQEGDVYVLPAGELFAATCVYFSATNVTLKGTVDENGNKLTTLYKCDKHSYSNRHLLNASFRTGSRWVTEPGYVYISDMILNGCTQGTNTRHLGQSRKDGPLDQKCSACGGIQAIGNADVTVTNVDVSGFMNQFYVNATNTVDSTHYTDATVHCYNVHVAGSATSMSGGSTKDDGTKSVATLWYDKNCTGFTKSGDRPTATQRVLPIVNNVAQIGDTKYESLKDAIAAAPDGVETEIDVIKDIDYTEFTEIYGSAIEIPSTKKIVLDINGYTVSGTSDVENHGYLIHNGGYLTIKNSQETGKITFKSNHPDGSYGYGTSTILNRGVLTVESGTVENTSEGGASYAVDNQTLWWDELIPIEFFMNGGNVECTTGDAAIRQGAGCGEVYKKSGEIVKNYVTISGGTVTGDIWIQNLAVDSVGSYTDLKITGGTVTGKVYDTATVDFSHQVISITGGYFEKVFSRNTGYSGFITGGYYAVREDESGHKLDNYVADGYEVIANTNPYTQEDYPYTIGKVSNIVKPTVVEEPEVTVDDEEKQEKAVEKVAEVLDSKVYDMTAEETGMDKVIEKDQKNITEREIIVEFQSADVQTKDFKTEKYNGQTIVTKMNFEVTPKIKVDGETRELEKSEIPESGIKFRLGVDKAVAVGTQAEVFHGEGEAAQSLGIFYVKYDEVIGEKYIEVIGHDFSPYSYELELTKVHNEAKIHGVSLVLKEGVNIRYYVEATADEIAKYDISYKFNSDTAITVDPIYKKIDNIDCHYFQVPVAIKDFVDKMTITIHDKTGTFEDKTFEYSVKQYCDANIKDNDEYVEGSDTKQKALSRLCRVLLDYASYMQQVMGYKTDTLANGGTSSTYTAGAVEGTYTYDYTGDTNYAVYFYGASAIHEDVTKSSFYFYPIKGTIGEYTFTDAEGKVLTPAQATDANGKFEGYYYVTAPALKITEYGNTNFVVKVKGTGIDSEAIATMSPLAYAKLASEIDGNPALAGVGRSMYAYYQTANYYFGIATDAE